MKKFSPTQKKWGKAILILIAIGILLASIFSYLINYRVKDILQLAIKEKSNNAYYFDAGAVNVSFLKKTIIIKNVQLFRKDTTNTPAHYQIRVKNIYFRIVSFKNLIVHKKLAVDSLAINSPSVYLHQHQKTTAKQTSLHSKDMEDFIQKLLQHLAVKSFHLSNASYIFSSKLHPKALKVDGINLTVTNFSNNENTNKHLFATEDIDLKIAGQHVSLPDGVHFFDFKKLHFSGKNQYFQVDSLTFLAKAVPGRTETKVYADQIRFKSSQLSSIFSKDELIIDTIKLLRPVLQLGKNAKQSTQSDPSKIKHLFTKVNFKYVDIENGSFVNSESVSKDSQYGTKKIDLKLYNLSYSPAKAKSLQADSVKLNLRKLKFLSKDGKVQLTVDEMALAKNEVVFRNAVYAPVHPTENSLSFAAPALKLKNVNLAALLDKRINAEQADLINPVIQLSTKPKTKSTTDTIQTKGFKRLFKMLNSLNGLIDVKYFNIKDGKIDVTSHAKLKTTIHVDQFNANILADKLLGSDTTLELKHAIPLMKFKQLRVNSPKLNLQLDNYLFKGKYRHNSASAVYVKLANGSKIVGKNIYWEWLDWDLFQNDKIIFIDSLKAGQIDINIHQAKKHSLANKKPLPKLQIGRFDISKLTFSEKGESASTHFAGNSIYGKKLHTKGNELIWQKLGGKFRNIKVINEKMDLSISSANINATANNNIENVQLKLFKPNEVNELDIPKLQLQGPFYNNNFKSLNIAYIKLINPEIRIAGKKKESSSGKKPFNIPLDFKIAQLEIEQAKISNKSFGLADTTVIQSKFDFKLIDIVGKKNTTELIAIKSSNLQIRDLDLNNKSMKVSGPLILSLNNLLLSHHSAKIKLSTAVNFQAKNINAQYQKDSTKINAKKIHISLMNHHLVYEQGHPLLWNDMLAKTTIENGELVYQNKKSTIELGDFKWFPQGRKLRIKDFSFKPNLSLEETRLNQPWQADYLTATAKSIAVNQIDLDKLKENKTIDIKEIAIDSAILNTSRDKRMPDKNIKEKLMPTKLLAGIKSTLRIDELKLSNSRVNVNETSMATGMQGTIPIENINVTVSQLTNRFGNNDSLKLSGTTMLMGKNKIALSYRESYADSLSGFKMSLQVEPINLATLSQISRPMAAVNVNSGTTENIVADWRGNKYFADGTILLPYQDLNISLLDKHHFERKTFVLFLENKLVNLILPNKNTKPAFIFFERNRNKFVFNYWIKTMMSGFVASVGLKGEKKSKKQEKALKIKYGL